MRRRYLRGPCGSGCHRSRRAATLNADWRPDLRNRLTVGRTVCRMVARAVISDSQQHCDKRHNSRSDRHSPAVRRGPWRSVGPYPTGTGRQIGPTELAGAGYGGQREPGQGQRSFPRANASASPMPATPSPESFGNQQNSENHESDRGTDLDRALWQSRTELLAD